MSRVAAEKRCDDNSTCKGLMWYNNGADGRNGYNNGSDGRTATAGWYQGCGGDAGSKKNTDWDTIVKPKSGAAHAPPSLHHDLAPSLPPALAPDLPPALPPSRPPASPSSRPPVYNHCLWCSMKQSQRDGASQI